MERMLHKLHALNQIHILANYPQRKQQIVNRQARQAYRMHACINMCTLCTAQCHSIFGIFFCNFVISTFWTFIHSLLSSHWFFFFNFVSDCDSCGIVMRSNAVVRLNCPPIKLYYDHHIWSYIGVDFGLYLFWCCQTVTTPGIQSCLQATTKNINNFKT